MLGLEFSTLSFGATRAFFHARLVGSQLRFERQPDLALNPYNMHIIDAAGLEIDDSDPSSPAGVFRVRTGKLDLTCELSAK